MCILFEKQKSSNALDNKTPHEMWFGYLPSVRNLRVFGSTYYALIPKDQRNKLGAQSKKCNFLGYEENSKAYRLYDEVNKKFVISRDVIFLETNKNDQSIERQLDRLENYPHPKKYYENEYEIPNLEGGIPILDQPLEFPYEAPTPLHEEVPAVKSEFCFFNFGNFGLSYIFFQGFHLLYFDFALLLENFV